MHLRVFHCKECGHRMRMAGENCGYCYARKSWYQRRSFWVAALTAPVAVVAALLALTH